jgi:hypothetical protein
MEIICLEGGWIIFHRLENKETFLKRPWGLLYQTIENLVRCCANYFGGQLQLILGCESNYFSIFSYTIPLGVIVS